MNRLTFKEPDGTFGVVGMNEQNQEQKLYMCVKKLLDYEQTGLSPEEVERLKEQLTEKDKEIKKLQSPNYVNKLIKAERSIVCDEIRKKYDRDENGHKYFAIMKQNLFEFLDKIKNLGAKK